MGIAYKNIWSLNTDEAVVTGILRYYLPYYTEVFMPMNAQMKDIDLLIMNIKNKKGVTIQVKGSRAYEPRKSEVLKYNEGSGGWFHFYKKIIIKSKADYFIFLIYIIEEDKKIGRRILKPHTITISTKKLKELCRKYKKVGKDSIYDFFLWINPKTKNAFDFRDKNKTYSLSNYLDKKGFDKLVKEIE